MISLCKVVFLQSIFPIGNRLGATQSRFRVSDGTGPPFFLIKISAHNIYKIKIKYINPKFPSQFFSSFGFVFSFSLIILPRLLVS